MIKNDKNTCRFFNFIWLFAFIIFYEAVAGLDFAFLLLKYLFLILVN